MVAEPKRQSDRSLLHPPVRRMLDSVEQTVWNSPYFKKFGRVGYTIETFRSLERAAFLWGKGRTATDFSKIGLSSRAKYANPSVAKVSWLTKPQYTMHYQRVAFDLVLAKKLGRKFTDLIWSRFYQGENLYARVGAIATDVGFRSFESSYQADSFHFELPIVMQPEDVGSCFAFSLINAKQKIEKSWRVKKKDECWKVANKLYLDHKAIGGSHPRDVFPLAVEKGIITGFERVSIEDRKDHSFWKKNARKGVVIFQRQRATSKSRLENIQEGKGIEGHAYVYDSYDHNTKGLWCRNSHSDVAMFLLTDLSVIGAAYIIR